MSFLFKNYTIVKTIYLLIRCYKTKSFLWNKNNTDRNGVNKQNTYRHTKHSEKNDTEKSMEISDTHFFKTTPLFYQPLPFYGKNLNWLDPPFFSKIFKNPPPPLLRVGSNYANNLYPTFVSYLLLEISFYVYYKWMIVIQINPLPNFSCIVISHIKGASSKWKKTYLLWSVPTNNALFQFLLGFFIPSTLKLNTVYWAFIFELP